MGMEMCVGVGMGTGWLIRGWGEGRSRGDEVGAVVACCADHTGEFLVVDKPPLVATISQHSSRWSMDGATREIWAIGEAHPCAAWKLEGGEITTILM